jgi:hypothetical protein
MIRQSSVYQETIYQKSQMEEDFLAIRPVSTLQSLFLQRISCFDQFKFELLFCFIIFYYSTWRQCLFHLCQGIILSMSACICICRLVIVVIQSDLIIYLVLGGLFFYTLYAGYLGWQCRRVRTIQNDINELKKQVKPVPITPDVNSVESSPPSPLELQIQQLTEVCSSRSSSILYALLLHAS